MSFLNAPNISRKGASGGNVSSIEVTKQPQKTIYYYGEHFQPEGMEVTGRFSNGLEFEIPLEYLTIPDVTFDEQSDGVVTVSFYEVSTTVTCTAQKRPEYIEIGNKSVGDIVYLNVSGVPTPFIIVQNGLPGEFYDKSCDGVWLLSKYSIAERAFDPSNNAFPESNVRKYLNDNFIEYLGSGMENAIIEAKIFGSPSIPEETTPNKVFLLNTYEVGFTSADNSALTSPNAKKLEYFDSPDAKERRILRISEENQNSTSWWLRSSKDNYNEYIVATDGGVSTTSRKNTSSVRPVLILPKNILVDQNENVTPT